MAGAECDRAEEQHPRPRERPSDASRRELLTRASWLAMGAGLAASYGTLAAMAVRYLLPRRPRRMTWSFVGRLADLAVGSALDYRAPTGERITIARQGAGSGAADLVALSSTCPHLGCQVHWEGHRDRFFCPCHIGVFDRSGKGISGPPGEAGQSLSRYALEVEDGLLFIEVPVEGLGGA